MNGLLRGLVVVNINQPDILDHYANIACHMERVGRAIGQNDLWIAASAAASGACLLTTYHDFDALHPGFMQVEWINPETTANGAVL